MNPAPPLKKERKLNQPLLSPNCIYKTLFGTSLVKGFAHVHKRRDCPGWDSIPHSDILTTPELESDTLDRSATTLHDLFSLIQFMRIINFQQIPRNASCIC